MNTQYNYRPIPRNKKPVFPGRLSWQAWADKTALADTAAVDAFTALNILQAKI